MTGADLRAARADLRLSQDALARVLGVTRRTVIRWEQDGSPIPRSIDMALDNIKRHRAEMAGQHYPLQADILRVMADEGIDQDAAIRAFGVEP